MTRRSLPRQQDTAARGFLAIAVIIRLTGSLIRITEILMVRKTVEHNIIITVHTTATKGRARKRHHIRLLPRGTREDTVRVRMGTMRVIPGKNAPIGAIRMHKKAG